MSGVKIKLPPPDVKGGGVTVEAAIEGRRSRREFKGDPLTLSQLGQVLWAAQGCTGEGCLRAAPSAGATYPIEIFAAAGEGGVVGLDAGVYQYFPEDHEVVLRSAGDKRAQLSQAAHGQACVLQAPVSVLFAADYARTTGRYGERGERYVHIEVGHAGENLYLEVESLGLGTVAVGAFDDSEGAAAAGIKKPLVLLYIMPVGRYE